MNNLRPPPKLTVSQFADQYRYLSSEASAEAGKWNTSRAEFQREMMDTINNPDVEQIVIMSSSQIGKTELLLNMIAYHIAFDPTSILMIQPTLQMAGTFSKNRISPMIRDSAILTDKVQPARSRDSNNTIYAKSYKGGSLDLVGSNSASSVSSRPVRVLLCDEVDRYSVMGTSEGDIIQLGKRRTSNFYNRKIILTSTPTIKGSSRIELAYEQSDQRKYYVPCQQCGHHQLLEWKNVYWNEKDYKNAGYTCESCGSFWSEANRLAAIKNGYWKADGEFNGTAGFWINALYSPWNTLGELAELFINSKSLPETLKVFTNTVLAESWEETGEKIQENELRERAESWGKKLPDDVCLLVAGVDTQDDRVEATILGFTRSEEVYVIDHHIIYGDPSGAQIWEDLDDVLLKKYKHPTGVELTVKSTCVDSGGHHTNSVYSFCKTRMSRRVFAIKGVGGKDRAMVGRPSKNNVGRVHLYPVGSDTIKNHVYGRLKIEEGPGQIHFPKHLDVEYFAQLTSEERVERFSRGIRKTEWVQKRKRNEAWDCLCYGYAAFALLNVNLRILHEKIHRAKPEEKKDKPIRPQRRGGSWMEI